MIVNRLVPSLQPSFRLLWAQLFMVLGGARVPVLVAMRTRGPPPSLCYHLATPVKQSIAAWHFYSCLAPFQLRLHDHPKVTRLVSSSGLLPVTVDIFKTPRRHDHLQANPLTRMATLSSLIPVAVGTFSHALETQPWKCDGKRLNPQPGVMSSTMTMQGYAPTNNE